MCLVWLKSPEENDKKNVKSSQRTAGNQTVQVRRKLHGERGGGDKHNQLALEEKMSGRYCTIDPCATSLT